MTLKQLEPTVDTLTVPQQIVRMDLDRIRDYGENLDFYNGIQWRGAARRGERRITLNYVKVFIDKITSYLMSSLSFVVATTPQKPGRGPNAPTMPCSRSTRPMAWSSSTSRRSWTSLSWAMAATR